MPLLEGQTLQQVKQAFETLTNPVKLIMFTQEFECQFCQATRELIQNLGILSNKIIPEIYDFQKDLNVV